MSKLSKQTIKNLIKLSRIDCTEEEQESLLNDLGKILAYIELLQDIDTNNIPPCNQVIEEMSNVSREDAIGDTMPRETFLANAPSQVGGLVRIPPVMKSN